MGDTVELRRRPRDALADRPAQLPLELRRHLHLERLGLHPSIDGIADLPEPRVYASTETHHVVGRALGVPGMGRRDLRSIPVDGDGRIDLDHLQRALDEDAAAGRTAVAIVGCVGDVDTGAVGSLPEFAWIARERETWLHVDGAYGGFGPLSPRARDLPDGCSRDR